MNLNPKLCSLFKIILWGAVVQLVLLNVSAALYAYKFTHLESGPVPPSTSSDIFTKTWKLFVGPRFYKMSYLQQPSFPYQPITLQTSDNIPLDAWYSSGDSSRACVIFFHGYTANKTVLLHEATRVKNRGYNVLLIDFRGHGKSGGNSTTFGVAETDEVEKAFAFARSKGNTKILLYGSSMGSVAIMKAVAENKVHPAAIIADMPCASLHDHLKARSRLVGYPAEPFCFFITLWTGIEKGYFGFGHNVAAYARKLNCPVLLQWGEKDRYVTREETNTIFRNIASPYKKLVVYPNTDHESLAMSDPLRWEKEVGGFMDSLTR